MPQHLPHHLYSHLCMRRAVVRILQKSLLYATSECESKGLPHGRCCGCRGFVCGLSSWYYFQLVFVVVLFVCGLSSWSGLEKVVKNFLRGQDEGGKRSLSMDGANLRSTGREYLPRVHAKDIAKLITKSCILKNMPKSRRGEWASVLSARTSGSYNPVAFASLAIEPGLVRTVAQSTPIGRQLLVLDVLSIDENLALRRIAWLYGVHIARNS